MTAGSKWDLLMLAWFVFVVTPYGLLPVACMRVDLT